ncbi:MAG: succinate dehydrogenase assembly factor 2 [Acidimicrobiales bacterium]|nr:succinate dehydrogenase assembly factor 2 [Hyphomonadaceae bacterium]RZV41514.1 MAG: succinate dehydrogenase assembly factor 2 [Acidimicrobiales bacterium]
MEIPTQINRRKRLIHRANYRGFKEADLILGGFAKIYALELTDNEVTWFEKLLNEKDHDIYDWISGAQPTPEIYQTELFKRICEFKPLGK